MYHHGRLSENERDASAMRGVAADSKLPIAHGCHLQQLDFH